MVRAGVVFTMVLMCVVNCQVSQAGPYPPAAGQSGSTAIAYNDPAIRAWATTVSELVRGPQDISNPNSALASFGAGSDALGPAGTSTTAVVSLGDGGHITVGFAKPIRNDAGPDFAVFENGLSDTFLELGFVEVSSNGADFFRFNTVSLTPTVTQVGSFGTLDPSNLNNLAGKYRVGYGTPFDLQELVGISPLFDVNQVRYVRVTDVVGSINPLHAIYDSQGNIINDPWPTAFASSGFDFDAIGVIHQAPEPSSVGLLLFGTLTVFRLRRRKKAFSAIHR